MGHVYARHTVNLEAESYLKYMRLCLDGQLLEGEETNAFEKAFAHFTGAVNCVGVASARAGFYMTLKAAGIGAGDEVIMPAYTFPSMPAVVVATGARPVFVDVDPETFNIDPVFAARAVTEKTRAIVAAHLFGRSADMAALVKLAEERDIYLFEDSAHANGATFDGRRVGSFGDAAFFSFGIGKNMPCFGGGAVVFREGELAGKVRKLSGSSPLPGGMAVHRKILAGMPSWAMTRPRVFPWTLYAAARILDGMGSDLLDRSVEEPDEKTSRFSPRRLSHLTNVQAAVGLEQLKRLPDINSKLAANGNFLAGRLADVATIKAPAPCEGLDHVFLYFRILVPERDRFRSLLLKRGVDTQRDDMRNCAGLEAFAKYETKCPVAEGLSEKSIELPNNIYLKERDLDYIAWAVRQVADEISSGGEVGE